MDIKNIIDRSRQSQSAISSFDLLGSGNLDASEHDKDIYTADGFDGDYDEGVDYFPEDGQAVSDDSTEPQFDMRELYASASDYMKSRLTASVGKKFVVDSSTMDDMMFDSIDVIYGYHNKEVDFTKKYNTELDDEEYLDYLDWYKNLPDKFQSTYDYDLQGFFADKDELQLFNDSFMNDPDSAHMTDRYKKPNHPTFSYESMWNGADGYFGGSWSKDGEEYSPSGTNIGFNGTRKIIDYLGGGPKAGGINAVFFKEPKLEADTYERLSRQFDSMVYSALYGKKKQEPEPIEDDPISDDFFMIHSERTNPYSDEI